MNVFEGKLTAEGKRFGIVVSRFNELLTRNLLDGAVDCLVRHGAESENIDVVWVPGSFEIGFVARKLAKAGKIPRPESPWCYSEGGRLPISNMLPDR